LDDFFTSDSDVKKSSKTAVSETTSWWCYQCYIVNSKWRNNKV